MKKIIQVFLPIFILSSQVFAIAGFGAYGDFDLLKYPAGHSGNITEGDGCLYGDLDATIDAVGATNVCTFNGQTVDGTVSGAEYFTLKLSAHKNWTGYISQISVTWSG